MLDPMAVFRQQMFSLKKKHDHDVKFITDMLERQKAAFQNQEILTDSHPKRSAGIIDVAVHLLMSL
jgi:hypothetical protein